VPEDGPEDGHAPMHGSAAPKLSIMDLLILLNTPDSKCPSGGFPFL